MSPINKMKDIEESLFADSNEDATNKIQNVCQSEVWDMFKRKEESQTQLTKIINSYDNSIKKSFSDLVQEVSGLKTQLSITTNERNVLMETVNNLNDEIRQLNVKLLDANPLSEPEHDNEDLQETHSFIEVCSPK